MNIEIGSQVRAYLDSEFEEARKYSLTDLPNICDRVSSCLINYIKALVIEYIHNISQQNKISFFYTPYDEIIIEGMTYNIVLHPDSKKPTVLNLVIRCKTFSESSPFLCKSYRVKLSDSAPYRYLETMTEKHFIKYHEKIGELCKTIIDSGYRWLEEFTIFFIERSQDELINELYSIIRRGVPEKAAEKIWLFLITETSSMVAFDKLAQRSVLYQGKKFRDKVTKAPVEILTRFASIPLDSNKCVSKTIIIPQNITKAFDPSRLPSVEKGFGLTNYVIFNGKRVVIQQ